MDDTGKKMNFMELLKATLTSAMEQKAREFDAAKYEDIAMSAAYKAAQKHNGGFKGGRAEKGDWEHWDRAAKEIEAKESADDQMIDNFDRVKPREVGLSMEEIEACIKARELDKLATNAELVKDPVNSPSHYTFSQYEVVDVLQAWFPNNPLLWQVGKYIARAEHKGNALQDLQKARWYLQREIDRLERIKAHG